MLLNEEMTLKQMINKYPIKNFVYFEGQLPYKLDINTDLYIFDIELDLMGNYNKQMKNRKVLFTTSQHWIENQKMPSIKSVLSYNFVNNSYKNIVSKFKLCIEIFDDEISCLLNDEENYDSLSSKVRGLYQTTLLFISSKYNHSLLGKDCVNISIEDCGAGIVYLYTFKNNGYKMLSGNIIPAYSVVKHCKHCELNFNKLLSKDDIIWLYFYNLAIYSFDRRDYLNAVIYSAISLESYLNYLITMNSLELDFKNYNKLLIENNKVPGFFTTLKFLKSKKVINNDIWKKIKSCFGSLSNNRNDIVHGNIKRILLNKDVSEESIDKLTDIYETCESDFVVKI